MRLRRSSRTGPTLATPRVVMKFADDIRLPPGGLVADSLERMGIASWARVAQVFPGAELAPLVRPLSAPLVHELQRKGVEVDRDYRPARLASYFAVDVPAGTPRDKLVSYLQIWGKLETTYVQGATVPPPPEPAADGTELDPPPYRAAAPLGVDIRYAWRFPGGSAPDHQVLRISPALHVAEQVLALLPTCEFGDVLLIDVAYEDRAGVVVPAEYYDAEFEAIRLATALGVTVVQSAGPGGYDLAELTAPDGRRVLDPRAGGFRDSGAVLVAEATAEVQHRPAAGTNRGRRVDCYAASPAATTVAEVAVTVQSLAAASRGYRLTPEVLRQVLGGYGTASADPGADLIGTMPDLRKIVDGDALRLAPQVYLRDFVGDDGEPHSGPVSASPDIIVVPEPVADPQAAFGEGSGTEDVSTLGTSRLAPDVNYIYVRVRNAGGADAYGTKATVYWAPAATLLVPQLWREIGAVALPTVPTGDALVCSPPIRWATGSVPAEALSPQAGGGCCFVAVLQAAGDPPLSPESLTDWEAFRRLIRDSDTIAARNLHVVPGDPPPGADPPGLVPLACRVLGAFDRPRRMELEVSARLPHGSRLLFEGPLALIDVLGLRREQIEIDDVRGVARVRVSAHGRQLVGAGDFPAGAQWRCRVLVQLPDADPEPAAGPPGAPPVTAADAGERPERPRARTYRVALRQRDRGLELGRITWLLSAR